MSLIKIRTKYKKYEIITFYSLPKNKWTSIINKNNRRVTYTYSNENPINTLKSSINYINFVKRGVIEERYN